MSSKIRIAEMLVLDNISDTDLLIVEDDEDTKQTTIRDLKRAISGDSKDPSSTRFYSSMKVSDLFNTMNIQISTLPTREQLEQLKTQVDNMQRASGTADGIKDMELVAARGNYNTLSDRLNGDRETLKEQYIQFPSIEHTSMIVNLTDIEKINATINCPSYEEATTLTISGKNKYKLENTEYDNVEVINEKNGLKITYTPSQNVFNIPIGTTLPAGNYALYAKTKVSDDYISEGSLLKLIHSDNSTTIIEYDYSDTIRFSIQKPIKAFQILPSLIADDGMWLELDDIMISEDDSLDSYYPYCDKTVSIPANTSFFDTLELYRCTISRSKGLVNVKATDTSYTGSVIKEKISDLESVVYDKEDYCGLLEQKGEYIYTINNMVVNNPNRCTIVQDKQKTRNGRSSAKITLMDYDPDEQVGFTLVPPDILNLSDNKMISFQFYIDKTLSERFAEEDGIKIMLSNDTTIMNPATNYIYFNIGKRSFVQGWNTIKLKISDFKKHGRPDLSNITQINFRIYASEFTEGMSLWLNSVIIDQRIKPTLLLAFDGFYDEAFDYQYPYLYTRNIPVTLFVNDKKTLTKAYMEKVATLKYQYGWELANDGCNPNKEIMIRDDNPRGQYLALKETKQWIIDNFTSNINSYSAPFGNLRPISVPILRDLGFKIGKETADAYCSFFSKEDFSIPMHILSNSEDGTVEKVKAKIDEVIEMGQVLCIYTNDVTKYGTDISAAKTSFETIVDYILKYVNQGKLECMTFSEFYDKCVK